MKVYMLNEINIPSSTLDVITFESEIKIPFLLNINIRNKNMKNTL